MSTAAIQSEATAFSLGTPPPKAKPKSISWETFQKKYADREDLFRYEWVRGKVLKTSRDFNQRYLLIFSNLQDSLYKSQSDGCLAPISDLLFLPDVHRSPTRSYFSKKQIARMASGEQQIPAFVIEIIQTHDTAIVVNERLKDYRDAGVQVAWLIYPQLRQVDVYSGIRLSQMTVCDGDEICSAAPALPAFALPAKDVFYHPDKKA